MQRRMKFLVPAVAATMAATSAGTIAATGTSDGAGSGEEVTLTMGSWRSDDVEQMETLLAAFHEEHPNITVSFEPTIPTEYDAALRTGLETGNAPDLFYVRSYASGRALYDEGFISPLTDLGLDVVVQRGEPRPVDRRRRHLRPALHRHVARLLLQRRPPRRARPRSADHVGRVARRCRRPRRGRHHSVRQRLG